MTSDHPARIRELLDRIGRIAAAEEWSDDLNPAQRSALSYLARANRFSRSPSNVADYLCTTRGTASQTLKALERKGLVTPVRSAADKRSISYDVTEEGRAAMATPSDLNAAIDRLPDSEADALLAALEATLRDVLSSRGQREFGVCRTCRYHQPGEDGATCALLNVSLVPMEAGQICHEHQAPEQA